MNRSGRRPDRRAGTSIAWRTPTMGALTRMKGKSRAKVEKGRIPWIAKILFADARVDVAIDSVTPSRGASRVAGLTLECWTERDGSGLRRSRGSPSPLDRPRPRFVLARHP